MKLDRTTGEILKYFERKGFEAFIVGGCVRDRIMGIQPADYDIATNATPDQVMSIFDKTVATGLKHGTVTVFYKETSYEVTTYRKEAGYSDSRRPDRVTFVATVEEDLSRRDFTANAMAYNGQRGLVDPFMGRQAIADKKIVCVGDPIQRFSEDALRILRALRFAAVLDFTIEKRTEQALDTLKKNLKAVARERCLTELTKLLCGVGAGKVLLKYMAIIAEVIPELWPMYGFSQNNPHHCYDVLEHTAVALDAAPSDPIIRWALLLHDIGKPHTYTEDESGIGHFRGHQQVSTQIAGRVLRRLRMDKNSIGRIETLIAYHDHYLQPTVRNVKKNLARLGEENFAAMVALQQADNMGQHPDYRLPESHFQTIKAIADRVIEEGAAFKIAQLAVDGYDMLELGLKGAEIGKMLDSLLESVVMDECPNCKETLIATTKKRLEDQEHE